MRLKVCSKSTLKYVDGWKPDNVLLVSHHPTEKILGLKDSEKQVVAVGGGSVIDTAKIISVNSVIAVPTTFAGASRSSHAVCWVGTKKTNVKTMKPVTVVKPELPESLPTMLLNYTKADCLCHAIESIISKKGTDRSFFFADAAIDLMKDGDWLNASLLAGDAMEISGTNVIHALSYPLTSLYGVSHGKALTYLLPKVLGYLYPENTLLNVIKENITRVTLNVDMNLIIDEALKYPKIYDSKKEINKKTLLRLLK